MIAQIRDSLETRSGRRFSGAEYSTLPKAAVCMLLKPDTTSKQLLVLLVKRKISESDPWSGHMAFPGGRASDKDQDVIDTVHREVMEETAIDLGKCELLGTLDDLLPGNWLLVVTPYVLVAPESTTVKIDSREIADYVWIPINFFMDKKNSSLMQFQKSGAIIEVPSFVYLGVNTIWGMTLRIIEDFLSKIR